MAELRVVDLGLLEPYRSQALWHGLATAMPSGAAPVLSFCRPAAPYVGLGFHRSIAEIDQEACARRGWPVIRRQIGGGPVYLDRDQLFFQITLPADRAPARVDRLYEILLAPAVEAFRALGIAAELRGGNDIAVADRRLSGTGAGRIGEAVTVVGNVIFRFPHKRMIECLAWPGPEMRDECRRLMRRHVSSLADEGLSGVTAEDARAALAAAYARAFDAAPSPGGLEAGEEDAIEEWVDRMRGEQWLRETSGNRRDRGRRVKICAGVWVYAAGGKDLGIRFSVIDHRLRRVSVVGDSLNGESGRLAEALDGTESRGDLVAHRLRGFGRIGARLTELAGPGLSPG